MHGTHAMAAFGQLHASCLSKDLGYSSQGVGSSYLQGDKVSKLLQLQRRYAAVVW